MGGENKVKVRLKDGREVWRITYVRYRDVNSGKFISVAGEPAIMPSSTSHDLDAIEAQVLSTLSEIAASPDLAARSGSTIRTLLGLVDKMKREKREADDEDWFILGRQLASEILSILEKQEAKDHSPG